MFWDFKDRRKWSGCIVDAEFFHLVKKGFVIDIQKHCRALSVPAGRIERREDGVTFSLLLGFGNLLEDSRGRDGNRRRRRRDDGSDRRKRAKQFSLPFRRRRWNAIEWRCRGRRRRICLGR